MGERSWAFSILSGCVLTIVVLIGYIALTPCAYQAPSALRGGNLDIVTPPGDPLPPSPAAAAAVQVVEEEQEVEGQSDEPAAPPVEAGEATTKMPVICYLHPHAGLEKYWGPLGVTDFPDWGDKQCDWRSIEKVDDKSQCDAFFVEGMYGSFLPPPPESERGDRPITFHFIESSGNHPRPGVGDLHPVWSSTTRRDSSLPCTYTPPSGWEHPTEKYWCTQMVRHCPPPYNQGPPAKKFPGHFIAHAIANRSPGRARVLTALVNALPAERRKDVHGYGGLLHNRDRFEGFDENGKPMTIMGNNKPEMDRKVYKHYKFVIAMENSACYDYITEKYWRGIDQGAVPIVYGNNADYDYVLPHPKAAIKLSDFGGDIGRLAAHLLYLDSNDTAYAEHLAWRQMPLAQLSPAYQRLMTRFGDGFWSTCAELYKPKEERVKPIERGSFHKWWNSAPTGGPSCHPL